MTNVDTLPPVPVKDDKASKKDDTKKKDEKAEGSALSDEDLELKERLETCVTTLCDEICALELREKALEMITTELREATSSMTSVPKPLKFLRPHYDTLSTLLTSLEAKTDTPTVAFRAILGSVMSVLAMTFSKEEEKRDCLNYKLKSIADYTSSTSTTKAEQVAGLGKWGHEYVRSLAGEIGNEYNARVLAGKVDPNDDTPFADILELVDVIIPFHVNHNAEAEAVDLLVEVQRLNKLLELEEATIDENNFRRICLYLIKTSDYMDDPEDHDEMLKTSLELFKRQEANLDALRVGLKMNLDNEFIKELFEATTDELMKKQMCLLLARHRVNFEFDDDDDLNEIIGNATLSENFNNLARDLDVVDAKTPEDIYKSHLAETGGFSRNRSAGPPVDSARANLASTFVNGFVNAGFGQDKLMTPEGNEWLYKNKDHGMMSAAASLGLILLWNVDEGLTQIDKFLYSNEEFVKAGAALGVGIVCSGVRNDADPAIALLTEHLESGTHTMKTASIVGIGIAYAGSGREDVAELLLPILENTDNADIIEVALAALSLGQIFAGKCDENIGGSIVQRLMESTDEELDSNFAKFLCLGLGLLFMGAKEKVDAMLEAVGTVEHKIGRFAHVTLEICAYAGSGNVLQIQKMLHECTEHKTEDAEHQAIAVLGIALITIGEDVGSEMALRAFDHLLHYCELPIKRAVPLALALLSVSNPDYAVVDQLSRLSHDSDPELSQNAIMGLGLVAAGTNNSRVAGLLRQLSEFYSKEAGHIFCVRIAQGLLHMAKGLMTLNPFHSDKMLLSHCGLGGILTFLFSCLDLKGTLLEKTHYILYYLVSSMNPRMLITVDGDLNWKPVTVRVGQAVETVGQAGKPKSITGFQTHTTPVLLGAKERSELGGEEFLSVSSVLEGIVIIKENPDYEPPTEDK